MGTRAGRFTVDDLASLADRSPRGEVLDGRLVLAPPPPRRHERAVGNLASRLWQALPRGVRVRGGCAVRLPDGDGPVPDLIVAAPGSGAPGSGAPVLSAAQVATVVEVVTLDGRFLDRVWKRERYADAGIPCYWRVELEAWPGYRGPLPVIVIRVRDPGGWREIVAPGGRLHTLPVAHRRGPDGVAGTVPVQVDPVSLTVRQATTW